MQWNPILQIPIGIIRVIGWPQKRSREFIVITYMLLPGQQIGLLNPRVLAGPNLHHMSNNAIMKLTEEIDIIAEIEPNQKEHIILALRKSGKNVVGYMGDGINYASALHSADAGISVDSSADVVKEAADFVLLEKDLGVLANFGNMFSMQVFHYFYHFFHIKIFVLHSKPSTIVSYLLQADHFQYEFDLYVLTFQPCL